MDDKKGIEEEKSKTTEDDSGKRDEPQAPKIVAEARAEREKLEAANKKKEELLNREEELAARKALSGDLDAGSQTTKKKPASNAEYAEAAMKGELIE